MNQINGIKVVFFFVFILIISFGCLLSMEGKESPAGAKSENEIKISSIYIFQERDNIIISLSLKSGNMFVKPEGNLSVFLLSEDGSLISSFVKKVSPEDYHGFSLRFPISKKGLPSGRIEFRVRFVLPDGKRLYSSRKVILKTEVEEKEKRTGGKQIFLLGDEREKFFYLRGVSAKLFEDRGIKLYFHFENVGPQKFYVFFHSFYLLSPKGNCTLLLKKAELGNREKVLLPVFCNTDEVFETNTSLSISLNASYVFIQDPSVKGNVVIEGLYQLQ